MAAKQFFIPHLTATVAGIAQPGARFYFYATGTLTPESTYSDSGLSVERTNPVVCDASGALPVTYLDNTKTYRVRICDKNDVLLSGGDIDPFIPGVFPDAAVLQPYQDAAEDAATAAAASASAAATSATNASDSEDNAASSASAASSSATAASASASAASSSASAAADSATAASASASAAATSATAADASADAAAVSAAAAAAAVVPVPTGGAEGQVLGKASSTDFDTEWQDVAAGIDIADRTALASADTGSSYFLNETGREGLFKWSSADLSTEVSADTEQGIYVPPASDTTGASGAWVRQLRDFSGEIDVRWFGYVADWDGSTGTDNADAINGAIAVCEVLAVNATSAFSAISRGAPSLRFPVGSAYTSATIEPLATIHIKGAGGLGTGPQTRLKFAAGVTAVLLRAYNTPDASTTGGSTYDAGNSLIEDIQFEGSYSGVDGDYHGLHLRTVAHVNRCIFYGFEGDGLYCVASVGGGGALEGNANSSRFTSVTFSGNRSGVQLGAGIGGADANNMLFTGCSFNNNRVYGVDDGSFLGNTYVGCHWQANTTGAFRTTNANAHSCFFGCYVEGDNGAISLETSSQIYGGIISVTITGGGGHFKTTGSYDMELQSGSGFIYASSSAANAGFTAKSTNSSHYRFNNGSDYASIKGDGSNLYYEYWNSGAHLFYTNGSQRFKVTDSGIELPNGRTFVANSVTVVDGSGVLQAAALAANAIGFSKFVAAGSAGFVGATGAGDYSHRTPTQVTAALDAMVGDSGSGGTKGLVPAPASGDSSKYLKGDGTWASVGADPWTYAFVASDVTNSTTTPSNVTGLSFTPAASKKYEFEAFLSLTSAATTTGAQVGLTWPSGSTFSMASIQIQSGAITVNETGGDATAELVCSVTASPSATASFPGKIKGTITMGGSPSGNVQVRIRSEVGASQVAVKAGSWIKYREIA